MIIYFTVSNPQTGGVLWYSFLSFSKEAIMNHPKLKTVSRTYVEVTSHRKNAFKMERVNMKSNNTFLEELMQVNNPFSDM